MRASVCGIWATLVLTSCGGLSAGGMKKRLAAMEDQLAALETAQARLEERLSQIQTGPSPVARKASSPGSEPAPSGVTRDRPLLEVVKLAPTGALSETPEAATSPYEAAANPPTTPSARPSIHGRGDAVESTLEPEGGSDSGTRPVIRGSGEKIEGRHLEAPVSPKVRLKKEDPG